jgi:lipopolysaccharide biosynthesis glycosyltransferase
MINYCTLFDRNYLYKGLTLYSSLVKYGGDFKLWILCLDDLSFDTLTRMSLDRVELISLADFENDRLRAAKKERSLAEYSWTCTSNLCRYLLKNKDLAELTYLDADLFFFRDPTPLFEEIGNRSIAIVEHRFPAGQSGLEKKVGRFNVGFVYFKNNEVGRAAAFHWADQVLDWCFWRLEDGKYGDQMYLDEWPKLYGNHLCIVKSKLIGSAPWNIKEAPNDTPIFYHFHAFKILSQNRFIEAAGYFIPRIKRELFYRPYVRAIKDSIARVAQIDPTFRYGFTRLSAKDIFWYYVYNKILPERLIFWLTKIKRRLLRTADKT